jgi:hypothetical protein
LREISASGQVAPSAYAGKDMTMTYRLASNLTGVVAQDRKEFLPHLVCSWRLDPASRRLWCAWAPPAASSGIAFLSPRVTATALRAGLAQAKARS